MVKLKKEIQFLHSRINRQNFKELLWTITGQAITLFFGFVIIKLLTQMGPVEFGKYTLTMTIASLLGLVFYGPLEQGFLRFYYHYLHLSRGMSFVKLIYRFYLGADAVFLVISLSTAGVAYCAGKRAFALIIFIAGLYIIALKTNDFFNSALNVIRKRKENYFLQGCEKGSIVCILLLLKFKQWLTLSWVLSGLTLITLISTIVKWYNYSKHLPRQEAPSEFLLTTIHRDMISSLLHYMSPFLIWGLTGWLQLHSEKWVIAQFLSTAEVGVYGVMIMVITALIATPTTIMHEYMNPIIFRQFADLQEAAALKIGYRYIRVTVAFVFVISLVAMVITYFLGRPIINILSSEAYSAHWRLLPLFCVGTGFFYIGQAMSSLGLALNMPSRYLPPKIIVGLLSLIANLFFIYSFGILGVAFSVIFTGAAYFIFILRVNHKIIGEVSQHKIHAELDTFGT